MLGVAPGMHLAFKEHGNDSLYGYTLRAPWYIICIRHRQLQYVLTPRIRYMFNRWI